MPTSIHEHPEEWLAASLADGLTPEERHALDEHLAGCAECRATQADLAALDATLLRDFPAAVGPAAGFEARLAAGFRCRYESGGGLARLRTLAGWLLRQRGARPVAVAAALLVLVGLGDLLTRVPATSHPQVGAVFAVTDGFGPRSSLMPAPASPPVADTEVARDVVSQKEAPSVGGTTERRRDNMMAAMGSITLDQNRTTLEGPKLTLGGDIHDSRYTGTAGFGDDKTRIVMATDGAIAFKAKGASSSAVAGNVGGAIAGGSDAAEQTSAAPATPAPDSRKLIRNARAELEVASFDAAVDAITAAATQAGGFLDTRNSARGSNGKLSGTLVVKVLPDNLDAFLARLRALGDLQNQTIQTEDITKAYFDTDARLRNARRMEDRLLKMLDEVKGKLSEVLDVERELGHVREDIEKMQGELKLYDSQVQYATVTLGVSEKDLHQPAAFLLHETATLALLAADVEKTAADVRRLADAAHAQVVRSDVSRDASGRSQANLRLLVAPDTATDLIAHVKSLGRVENFNLQDERTAQNGAPPDTAGADAATVEREPVAFNITVMHDEQVSRQVSFTLVAGDVDRAFDKARVAATATGGDVTASNVAHGSDGHASATLGVRVPAAAEAGLVGVIKTLGRASEEETHRVTGGAGNGEGPVLITVNLVDAEPAAQQTSARVQTSDVERRAGEIKREAAAVGAVMETSNFSSESDGRQSAELGFRLPMAAYPAFIEQVRALGEVKGFIVRRQDRPGKARVDADGSTPVTVELSLFSEGRVVAENSGLAATLRRTFGEGAGALMWSVQMIGVAVAFLAPWGVLAAAVAGGWWWLRRRQFTPDKREKLP